MEDKVKFLMESLQLIEHTQGNAGLVYAFWRANIDKIDTSLVRIMPDLASQLLRAKIREQQAPIGNLFGQFSNLIQKFPFGHVGINLELAIAGYLICTSIFTPDEYPTIWAMTQMCLGSAYQTRIAGDRKDNLELAITAHRASLQVYTRQAFPLEWAAIQVLLGAVYGERIEGDRKDNLELAIAAHRASLEVYTRRTFPVEWARTQYNLGFAYKNRIEGDRKDNLELAIAAYRASLEVYTRQAFPFDWAMSQNNLGGAYNDRIEGDRKENLELAIQAYRAALKVYTQQDFPIQWARIQANLENLYAYCNQDTLATEEGAGKEDRTRFLMESLNLIIAQTQGKGNAEQIYVFWRMNLHRIDGSLVRSIPNFASQLLRAQSSKEQQILVAITLGKFGDLMQRFPLGNQEINIELAIASHQICASIFTKNEHSRLWAISQKSLGIAYQTWTAGERKENIEQAIQALRASLEVRTSQNFPFEWAMTQNSLGVAYNDRIEGERKENIEQAIHSFQVAQEVHTRQNFPFEWAMTQTNLGNAYGNRIEGEHKENVELAIVAYRAALEVRQPDLLPLDCLTTGHDLGNLGFKEGNWQIAIEGFEKAIAAVEISRSWAMSARRRQEIINESIGIYEKMLRSCINANRLDLALQTIERVRSKRLVDLMAAPDLYPQGEIPEPVRLILERIATTQQQMDNLRSRVQTSASELASSGTRDRAAIAPPTAEIHALEAQKQYLLEELSRYDAVSAQLVEISPPDITQIQTELLDRPDVALLSFYTTTQDTHILIVRSNSIQCFTCSGQGLEQLQRLLFDEWVLPYINDRVSWEQNMPQHLQQLAEKLELDRLVAEHLQNIRELILIPHLLLHMIPFAALPLNGNPQYLGDRFLLRYAPGCQVLKFCTDRNELPSQQKYGTVENTTEDLPFSAIEGEAIAQIFQIEEINRLRGSQQATRDAYKQLLARVNFVASCHHAQSRLDNPLESSLILANETRVTLGDLLSPGWRFADLGDVFLSCCETGMTMPKSLTDELLTIGTGFLCAGARSVISCNRSFPPVKNEPTEPLWCMFRKWLS